MIIDQVPYTDTALVRIFTISGRLLRVLRRADGTIDSQGRAHWDGKTMHGNRVVSGFYLYQVEDGSLGRAVKFVVIGGR